MKRTPQEVRAIRTDPEGVKHALSEAGSALGFFTFLVICYVGWLGTP